MENNEYDEFIAENNLIFDKELIDSRERMFERELIPVIDEDNVGVKVFSDNENEEPTKRQEDRNSQSNNGQDNLSSPSSSPSSVSSSVSASSSGASSSVAGSTAGASTAMGGIACAAAAGVTLMVIIVSMIVNINISFLRFEVSATCVDYVINVKLELEVDKNTTLDYKNLDTGLFLCIENSDQSITTSLNASDKKLESTYNITSETDTLVKIEYIFRGHVDGLSEGANYKLEVYSNDNGNRKTHHTQNFKTKTRVSKINSVKVENKREIDGNLYFQLDFIDENNYYSNFNYMLIESGPESTVCRGSMGSDISAMKSINISDLLGKNYMLIISYDSIDPRDAENPTIRLKTEIVL